MKTCIRGLFYVMFSNKFSIFDLIVIVTLGNLADKYDNPWLILLIIPFSVLGGVIDEMRKIQEDNDILEQQMNSGKESV